MYITKGNERKETDNKKRTEIFAYAESKKPFLRYVHPGAALIKTMPQARVKTFGRFFVFLKEKIRVEPRIFVRLCGIMLP